MAYRIFCHHQSDKAKVAITTTINNRECRGDRLSFCLNEALERLIENRSSPFSIFFSIPSLSPISIQLFVLITRWWEFPHSFPSLPYLKSLFNSNISISHEYCTNICVPSHLTFYTGCPWSNLPGLLISWDNPIYTECVWSFEPENFWFVDICIGITQFIPGVREVLSPRISYLPGLLIYWDNLILTSSYVRKAT